MNTNLPDQKLAILAYFWPKGRTLIKKRRPDISKVYLKSKKDFFFENSKSTIWPFFDLFIADSRIFEKLENIDKNRLKGFRA